MEQKRKQLIAELVATLNAIKAMLTATGITVAASRNRQGWAQVTPIETGSIDQWAPPEAGGFNISLKVVSNDNGETLESAVDIVLSLPDGTTEYYTSHQRGVPLQVFYPDEYATVTQWTDDEDLAQWDGDAGDGLARIVEVFGNIEQQIITDQPTLHEEDLQPDRTCTVTHAVRKHGDDRARAVYEIMRGGLIVDADGNAAVFDIGTAEVVAVETTSEMFPHDTLNMARKHATAKAPSRRRSTPSEQRGKASCAVSRAPAFEWHYYVELYQVARRCREIAARYYTIHELAVPDYLQA